jgi:hypothetical protein
MTDEETDDPRLATAYEQLKKAAYFAELACESLSPLEGHVIRGGGDGPGACRRGQPHASCVRPARNSSGSSTKCLKKVTRPAVDEWGA